MRLNTANRSFFTLISAAMVPYALLALFGCGVLSLAVYRVVTDGVGGLHRDGQDLRPALAFFAIVIAGSFVAARSVARQVAATRTLADEVAARLLPEPDIVASAAAAAGLGGRVDLVDDDQPYSFTYGIRPARVALSRGLLDALEPQELDAVLHHERYHARNADTLKAVVAHAAASAFFFLPALGHLRDRYLAGRELAADRAATRCTGEQALAGALVKVLDGPDWADVHTAAAMSGGVLEHRVRQLEDGREPTLPRVPAPAGWLTVVALALLVVLFAVAIAFAGSAVGSMGGTMRDNRGGALAMVGDLACSAAMLAVAALAVGGTLGRPSR